MPRYNLVYYPSDEAFAAACVAHAQRSFAGIADDYLLDGDKARPHVTLCQFEAPAKELPELWKQAVQLCAPSRDFMPGKPYLMPGQGHLWAGLGIRSEAALADEQQKFADFLVQQGLKPLTASGKDYFPHLTFASIKALPGRGGIRPPDAAFAKFLMRRQPFHLALGVSDESGAFQKKLYSLAEPAL